MVFTVTSSVLTVSGAMACHRDDQQGQAHFIAVRRVKMLPRNNPDRIRIVFDGPRLVANAGLLLPATLAQHLN